MMSAEIWSKVKTFVGLDGDLDEAYEEEETMTNEPKKSARNIVGLPAPNSQEMVVLEPRSFDDALGIIENLRSRRAVILNLNGLTAEQSQRLVDFVSGACHALDGNQERIGDAIFLFAPSNVKINALHAEQSWMPGANQAAAAATTAPSKDLFWRVR
jgi:cell division inhibitor SepF